MPDNFNQYIFLYLELGQICKQNNFHWRHHDHHINLKLFCKIILHQVWDRIHIHKLRIDFYSEDLLLNNSQMLWNYFEVLHLLINHKVFSFNLLYLSSFVYRFEYSIYQGVKDTDFNMICIHFYNFNIILCHYKHNSHKLSYSWEDNDIQLNQMNHYIIYIPQ